AGRAGRDCKKAFALLIYNEDALTALKKRVIQGFPDKNYIRQVYRVWGDFFGLEEGFGHGLAFEFDPEHF
ncbi:RecQ family ATP-dependent DNA helicase, partial [Odoribacter splanchnicus]|nr:RecQ family ATP-dependent DNA helicase [Odoribacter splanchnicus]